MSVWTHVCAIIRFDYIGKYNLFTELNIEGAPEGSEDGLRLTLCADHHNRCILTIVGDLRDFANKKPIITYLNKLCRGHLVRDGVARIETEGQKIVVLEYSFENKWRTIEVPRDAAKYAKVHLEYLSLRKKYRQLDEAKQKENELKELKRPQEKYGQ